jgi:hypothetical protein
MKWVLILKEIEEADTCKMIYSSHWEASDRTDDKNAFDRPMRCLVHDLDNVTD